MTVLPLLLLFGAMSLIGYKVISEVPSLLHTPLMSGMNALSGVTVLGALVATTTAATNGSALLGALGVILATVNVVGGFVVTHRMLRMFKQK